MAAVRATRFLLALGVFQALGRFTFVESRLESDETTQGKPIMATSTCGVSGSEKYCYPTGEANVVCDVCKGDNTIERVTDGHPSHYWQSAVLSNGPADEHVNITIDLQQKFHIHHIAVTTAFTPQPAVWIIEGSRDNGKWYTVLKYLVSEAAQCLSLFGLREKDTMNGLCAVQEIIPAGLSEKVAMSFDNSDNVIADHLRLRYLKLWQPKKVGEFGKFSRFYTLKEISVKAVLESPTEDSRKRFKRQACYCSRKGTAGYICNYPGRVCPCKRNYAGKRCNKCSRGFFNFPKCSPCACSRSGSLTTACKRDGGQCRCKPAYQGRACNRCQKGYSGYPNCKWCGCHRLHTTAQVCDKNGKCLCKENYDGISCVKCKHGYSGYPLCKKQACSCKLIGSTSTRCNSLGLCPCKKGYTGQKCDRCSANYYGFPDCKQCACDSKGSVSSECDSASGQCICYPSIAGRQCDRCASGWFGFPRCRPCSCNPYGTKRNARRGSSNCASGREKFQCKCKRNVGGNTCDVCKDLYYSFSPRNPLGCKACGCFKDGTIGGLQSCDQKDGNCPCKPFLEEGKCYECRRGYHSLSSTDIFGCKACKCNPGGALYGNCDKRNGKCRCRKNIAGPLCDRPRTGPVYIPSLHHLSFEIEDGTRGDGKKLRYEFDLNAFPSYSWKGYVRFSPEQSMAVLKINIPRRSTYRILFRCIFEPIGFPTTTRAMFTVSPNAGVPGYTVNVPMNVASTQNGRKERSALLTVSQNNIKQEFLMFKGTWTISIACKNKYFMIDYLVFMPEEYFDGTILETARVDPCVVDGPKDKICDLYSYPDVAAENVVKFEAENGYFSRKAWRTNEKLGLKYYSNNNVLKQLKTNGMVVMNKQQSRFSVEINIKEPGYYVFAVHYYHPNQVREKIDMYVHRERGSIHIMPCVHQFGCRQVVMKEAVKVVKVFDLGVGATSLKLFTSDDANIAIDYITAIPYKIWDPIYITPALKCRWLDDKCIASKYVEPTVFTKLPATTRERKRQTIGSKIKKFTVMKFRRFFNKQAGYFYLVIQYKQTKHIVVTGQVTINTYTTTSRGFARFKYCPNTEFCRIVIQPNGKGAPFKIRQGTTSIEIRVPFDMDVQLSWLYKIPSGSYSDNVLSFMPVDNSQIFVEKCSKNNYIIDPRDKGYCMKSSFALTTHFNNGALPCRCSHLGARTRFCNKVYGQCLCRKPTIIGRRCSQCASGYYGFPYCRRCTCDPRGSETGTCDYLGRCKCKANFTGINCNRCKSGYYEFPTCQPCDCDTRGSLSTFCTSKGQCQCRRSFDGRRCDKCRIGFFGFPECKECNCDPSGIRPLQNLPSGCNSSNAVKCSCKDNVEGKHCDTCKDLHYRLEFYNPKGCKKCTCSSRGTNGELKTCDKVTGQCSCKPLVSGLSCAYCDDGSASLKDYSIFGCQGCECNYGGSWDNVCNKRTGKCTCRRNVAGEKCTRVKADGFYIKTLHHVHAEFEDATLSGGQPVTIHYSEREFSGFSGRGYVPASGKQSSLDVTVAIPRPTKYRLLIRYVLDSSWSIFGQVTISPTDKVDPLPQGYESVQVVSLQFQPTATRSKTFADFLTVKKNGKEAEFFLSRGKWRISLFGGPSKLLLDYLVMIPEEYYKATHLRQRVQRACLVDSPSNEFCVEYKYLNLARIDAAIVPTKLGEISGARSLLPYAPFDGVVLNRQSQLYLPVPIKKLGKYVIMVTYYQEAKTVSDIIVGVTSGFIDYTARIRSFHCKYTFACRQVAIDNDNKVMTFELFPFTRNLLSIGAQTTVAVESVSIIPYEKWNIEYTLPAEYCVKAKGGCLQTTYNIHRNAIRVDAEKAGKGMKPAYAKDPSVRAAYISGNGVLLRIKSRILKSRYKVLVHYYQPSHSSFNGRIIIESGRSTALILPFKHCPNVGGCRSLAHDKYTAMGRTLQIIDKVDITISIPEGKEIWIDYILFVPARHFNPSMENQEPVSLATKFIKDCSKNNFIIDKSSSDFCKKSLFTITTRFNLGVTSCKCNREGSTSLVCDKLGGQCSCKKNVVGRKCDQCKGGYAGFPNCRRS